MELRKYSNRLVELVEEGILDPVGVVRMCVKYMSEDDVEDMCSANELSDLMFEDEDLEEDDEDEEGYWTEYGCENEEEFIDKFYHDCSEEELRKMGCFANLDEEE